MKLEGKKIVLTGATGGIGAEVAKALAARGAVLLLSGRRQMELEIVRDQLQGEGHECVLADITSAEGRRRLIEVADRFGMEILINNAGANELALLEDLDDAQIEKTLAVNLISPMELCRDALPILKQNKGTLLNVGSILGSIGYAGSTAYCASKFGLRGFTEALRRELADTPVNVIYFAPRATDTALNSDSMKAMNQELGAHVDSPLLVAEHLVSALQQGVGKNVYLGWPESLFVRINSILPQLVDKSLLKQLATIRKYARGQHYATQQK